MASTDLLRDWAEECRLLADVAKTDAERSALLREAEHCLKRAEQLDSTTAREEPDV